MAAITDRDRMVIKIGNKQYIANSLHILQIGKNGFIDDGIVSRFSLTIPREKYEIAPRVVDFTYRALLHLVTSAPFCLYHLYMPKNALGSGRQRDLANYFNTLGIETIVEVGAPKFRPKINSL